MEKISPVQESVLIKLFNKHFIHIDENDNICVLSMDYTYKIRKSTFYSLQRKKCIKRIAKFKAYGISKYGIFLLLEKSRIDSRRGNIKIEDWVLMSGLEKEYLSRNG